MTHNTRSLRVVSAGELLQEQIAHPRFLVDGLLPAVGTVLLAGPPKSYKTMLTLQVATAVSAGMQAVIGRAIHRHGPVLFVEEEGGRRGFRDRLALILEGLDVAPRDARLSFALHQGVRLDDDAWLQAIDAKLDEVAPALVILDPLAFLHEGEENSNTDMAGVMKGIAKLAHSHETLILVIHHVSKPGERSRGRATDQLRGASALGGATDANLIIKKRADGTATLTGEFRDSDDFEMGLRFDSDSLLLEAMDHVPVGRPRKADPVAVAQYVESCGGTVSAKDVAEEFEVVLNTAKKSLRDAAARGLVEHSQHPVRGHQYWVHAAAA